MFIESCDDIRQRSIDLVVIELACAGIGVSAAAVCEAELADIGRAVLVYDGLADHDCRILLLKAPCYMNAHLDLRPHCIDHESVACIDRLKRS